MTPTIRATLWLSLAAAGAGCNTTIRLSPAVPDLRTEPVPVEARIEVPAKTAAYEKVVRVSVPNPPYGTLDHFATIRVGEAVSQYAEAYLGRIFSPGADVTVRVDLLTYAVDGPVTTNLRFTVTTQERLLFQRDYRGVGESGWGAMLLGRESAIRQASEESLRSCFEQFISDVQQEHPRWHRDAAQRVASVGAA